VPTLIQHIHQRRLVLSKLEGVLPLQQFLHELVVLCDFGEVLLL
jgi:hypothetical protein